MTSRNIISVSASFIVILFVASIVGCSSDNTTPPPQTVELTKIVKVYTAGSTTMPVIEGIHVQLLDNETGEQVVQNGTPVEAVSDVDGKVTFTIEEGQVVAVRVIGGPQVGTPATDYIDAVQWNNRTTDQDNTAYLLKWVDIYLLSFFATGDSANHAADGGQKAVFAAHVLFVGPNGVTDTLFPWQPVGCATVKYFDSTDTEEADIHFQYQNAAGLPAGGKVQTPAANGGFASFTITPGKTTVKAYDYTTGDELTDPANPNVYPNMFKSDDDHIDVLDPVVGYDYPTGPHPVINLSNVYIKAQATNPEAACTAN